jgi:hypothetical protein
VRRPAQLLAFDTVSGKRLAAVPCVDDTDDLLYDARCDRMYVIGGRHVDVLMPPRSPDRRRPASQHRNALVMTSQCERA